jgi:hypothetical protein
MNIELIRTNKIKFPRTDYSDTGELSFVTVSNDKASISFECNLHPSLKKLVKSQLACVLADILSIDKHARKANKEMRS